MLRQYKPQNAWKMTDKDDEKNQPFDLDIPSFLKKSTPQALKKPITHFRLIDDLGKSVHRQDKSVFEYGFDDSSKLFQWMESTGVYEFTNIIEDGLQVVRFKPMAECVLLAVQVVKAGRS